MLGVGLVAFVFFTQVAFLGLLSAFNYGTIHSIIMPCMYAFVGYIAHVSQSIIRCHNVFKAEVEYYHTVSMSYPANYLYMYIVMDV